ncbi:LysR family transcriptional regulator [Celeribacter litoreus]|uniref:LysR family transcriptional regulator n=1 Tax=Celeribacter litoreus TaxID=2876714 RepID=UPI001CCBFE70|nr:LysR family transcriptional regulator [Celeribacter litoreus]MCA0045021.1 LysR family transcriptional regulator [Celeribacter litoreus]
MHKPNWDDFRYVLAVARSGSVSGAARELGVNHATVLRRVSAIEEYLGVELFQKSVRGYEIAPEKIRLIEAAREVEAAVSAVERLAQAGEAPLSGVIRVTSTDAMCQMLLPRVLSRIAAHEDELSFELLCANSHSDMARLHADVTVRPTFKLSEELQGEIVAQMGFGFYARTETIPEDLWIGMVGAVGRSHAATKLREELKKRNCRCKAVGDSYLTLKALAEEGMGRVLLPAYIGDSSPYLVRVKSLIEIAPLPIYVASHVDLADSPRLRQARQRIAAGFEAEESRLSGLVSA